MEPQDIVYRMKSLKKYMMFFNSLSFTVFNPQDQQEYSSIQLVRSYHSDRTRRAREERYKSKVAVLSSFDYFVMINSKEIKMYSNLDG